MKQIGGWIGLMNGFQYAVYPYIIFSTGIDKQITVLDRFDIPRHRLLRSVSKTPVQEIQTSNFLRSTGRGLFRGLFMYSCFQVLEITQ